MVSHDASCMVFYLLKGFIIMENSNIIYGQLTASLDITGYCHEKAMKEDRVRWKKTGNERYSRVLVVKKDVEKLINNQL